MRKFLIILSFLFSLSSNAQLSPEVIVIDTTDPLLNADFTLQPYSNAIGHAIDMGLGYNDIGAKDYTGTDSSVKIPIDRRYVYQDNSQQSVADKLVDGDTTVNYVPTGPYWYSPFDIVFSLYDYNARVDSVKIWIYTQDLSANVQIITVRKSDNVETVIGTFTGGNKTHFVFPTNDRSEISKIIFRNQGDKQFGSEIELYGAYTTPPVVTDAQPRRPLGWEMGFDCKVYDMQKISKINAIKSLGITNGSVRTFENAKDVSTSDGKYQFEGAGSNFSIDSSFHLLHMWSDSIYTWKANTTQWGDQLPTWDVIDDYPNKYIKGTVNVYNNNGSSGNMTIHVIEVQGATEQTYGRWYIYKNGVLINKTLYNESFSSTLVGKDRYYNTGGNLGLVPGDTVVLYKSQTSVNPISFWNNNLPNRNYDTAHLRSGQAMFVQASRGGTNTSVPDYPIVSGQRMLKGTGLYKGVEPANEPNGWWVNFDGFWNGKTIEHLMNMSYDGSKNAYSNVGAKQADSTIDVIMSGLAADKIDIEMGMTEEARLTRGYNPDGTINVPYDVINCHIYPSANGQYGGGIKGTMAPEDGMLPHMKDLVWFRNHYARKAKIFISEWGNDVNPGSPLHAGCYGPYDREAVAAFWMVRTMLLGATFGIDRMQYYRLLQDWPESTSSNSTGQFATMRLLRQPIDGDENYIVRSRQGDYMAQLSEFKNYVFQDSLSTGSPYVHAYRYVHNDSAMIALWSQEIMTIDQVADTTQFQERTGTISLPIPVGDYTVRKFMDDSSAVMGIQSSGTSSGNVTFNYAAKPIIIQTNTTINQSPSANAGIDQTITLPTNSVTLTGSGSDPDGSISSYAWSQVSGPNSATIVSATSASTSVTGLIEGTYVFRLTVTDDQGATASDDVQVIVNPVIQSGNSGIIHYKRVSGDSSIHLKRKQ